VQKNKPWPNGWGLFFCGFIVLDRNQSRLYNKKGVADKLRAKFNVLF